MTVESQLTTKISHGHGFKEQLENMRLLRRNKIRWEQKYTDLCLESHHCLGRD